MKKLLVAALMASVSLGGCASLNSAVTNLPVEIQTAVSQTQAIAVAICSFEPTVATAGAVIAALFPGGGAIDAMANSAAAQICAAVAPAPLAAGKLSAGPAYVPMVAGVVIEGSFVKKSVRYHVKKNH